MKKNKIARIIKVFSILFLVLMVIASFFISYLLVDGVFYYQLVKTSHQILAFTLIVILLNLVTVFQFAIVYAYADILDTLSELSAQQKQIIQAHLPTETEVEEETTA